METNNLDHNEQTETEQKSEQGQSLVEFAISLVILLILVSGVIDLGRAFFTVVSLNDAVKEGATYGSICPADQAGITERLIESATEPVDLSHLESGQINICVSNPDSSTCGASLRVGNDIQVSVAYNHEISTPFLGSILGKQEFTLRATAKDRILRTTCLSN
jgi:Flp pilus assembly protein TadG